MQEKPTDQFFNKAGTSPQTKLGTYDMLLVRMVADVVLLLSVRLVWNRRATLLHEICMPALLFDIGDRHGHFGAK